ncbi:outer membrane beta-barrel domain-containing protein [Bdellovibrio sp. qaytius]|nr:outer membrane beta-barrel domain-containing protein [Bdellovibrio sp. qaytius]
MIRNIIFVLLFASLAHAADSVEVPLDELAQESVYPVFDHPQSVKNRNVATQGRIDVGIFGGYALTEPIYDTTKFGIAANYHFSELHSLGVLYSQNSSGLSKDAEALKESHNLDFNRAPKPTNTILLDYNFKPYYGKLSLSKLAVINTTIYASGSAGMVAYENKSYPAVAVGLGERFYFNRSLSLKTDLRLFMHQAPIPFKKGSMLISNPTPAPDSFKERLTYTTNLEVGLNYLF